MSMETTEAPAALRTGACCPPPAARQSTSAPPIFRNQCFGTDLGPASVTVQSPRRALSITPASTGRTQGQFAEDALFHPFLLIASMSTTNPRAPFQLWLEHLGNARCTFRRPRDSQPNIELSPWPGEYAACRPRNTSTSSRRGGPIPMAGIAARCRRLAGSSRRRRRSSA